MTYRNRRILDLAHRVNDCQMQIEGVCEGYSAHGCEPAHSNSQRHGKGFGNKAADYMHVAACHSCHAEFDQGRLLSKDQKQEIFNEGWERTISLYFEKGWLVPA